MVTGGQGFTDADLHVLTSGGTFRYVPDMYRCTRLR